MKVWMVQKIFYQTGKTELIAAYFSEENARWKAAQTVGQDDISAITLITVDVLDEPVESSQPDPAL